MGFFSKDKGEEATLTIEGMSCQHCVGKVENGLKEIAGVLSAKVDLAAKEAKVSFDPGKVTVEVLKQKVVDAGYRVL